MNICNYPPCDQEVYGVVKNPKGATIALCKEHYLKVVDHEGVKDLGHF